MTTSASRPKAPQGDRRIVAAVTSWPGVDARTGSRGELSLNLGRRELGHLHGDRLLHIGFPKAVWHELHDAGRIEFHPVFPDKPGYAQRRLEHEDDIEDAIALLRLNYDRAVAAHGPPTGATTMRAIEVRRFGGPEVLEVRELDVPRPAAGEALVAVAVADVISLDALMRSGAAQDFFDLRPPYVPGSGVAGRVLEVGSPDDSEWVGRDVVARLGQDGAYAEQTVASVKTLVEVPDGLSLSDAGALVHDGLTAVGLLEAAAVQPGERVLITAAAGGMGVLLIQALVAAGAVVVGAARGERKLALVEKLGAIAVDCGAAGWSGAAAEAAGGPFAVVLDGVGGAVGGEAFSVTTDGGRFSAHGAAAGDFAPVNAADAAARGIVLRGIQDVDFPPDVARRLTAAALDAARAGRVRPVVGRTFPLEEAALAHEAIEQRRAFAKTLLTMARPMPAVAPVTKAVRPV